MILFFFCDYAKVLFLSVSDLAKRIVKKKSSLKICHFSALLPRPDCFYITSLFLVRPYRPRVVFFGARIDLTRCALFPFLALYGVCYGANFLYFRGFALDFRLVLFWYFSCFLTPLFTDLIFLAY